MGLFTSKKIIEYKILISTSFHDLQDEVNKYIRNGWQPQGGLSSFNNYSFMQAMVKYK
jgi:hypothetical protein